jgi:hypothetical protein
MWTVTLGRSTVFKSKTVFVIGAGANAEVGLPLGSGLKQDIARRLKVTREGHHAGFDNELTGQVLANHLRAERIDAKFLKQYMEAAQEIVRNMPLAASIDNFLFTHKDDEYIKTCGKMGILISILEAEKRSFLYVDPHGGGNGLYLDHNKLEETWLDRLAKMLFNDVTVDQVKHVFDNVSFIIFNYDRCVEAYLEQAVWSYFRLPREQAQELVRGLLVLHPYGQLGPLPWQEGSAKIGFGDVATFESGGSYIENIRTFSEQVTEHSIFDQIKQEMATASTIVFLGFAYHPLNMKVLKPDMAVAKTVFGTDKGISHLDLESVRVQIATDLLWGNGANVRVQAQQLSCVGLLDAFSRTLPFI